MWQGIVGHDAIVEQFRRSLAAGRLASTYLFVGPEGVGKRKFALALAKSLLCTVAEESALAPCGKCHACALCEAGSHPDLHLVARWPDTKTLRLEQFVGDRDHRNQVGFCHDLALRPLLGGRRIGIIDDADWFTAESANSLLKLLEEPPPSAALILIGTSRSRQLPTILSRAQVIRFHGIPPDELRDLIQAHGLAADAAAAQDLAERSSGSVARARAVSDSQVAAMRDRFVSAWRAGDFDPTPLSKEFDAFIAAGGKEAEARRGQFRLLLQAAMEALREAVVHECAAGEVDGPALAALDRTLDAEEQLDRNANLATLLECWLDDLAGASAPPSAAAS